MGALTRIWRRLANVFSSTSADAGLSRELASHAQLLQDDFERRGLPPDAARLAARCALGSTALIADRHRDARSFAWIDDAARDLRYAARLLRRNSVFTLTAALSLAIGIGANTTVFTVVNALLLRSPAGVVGADRLVDIGSTRRRGGFGTVSYPNYLDLRERTTTLDAVYATSLFPQPMNLGVGESSAIEPVFAVRVTTNYFAALGAAATAGRLFETGDSERSGASPIAVLSDRFWNRRFARDPGVVGRRITLNGVALRIVGVAAEGFHGTGVRACDLWVPIGAFAAGDAEPAMLESRAGASLLVGGRLKPGITVARAAAETIEIGRALEREYPAENRDRGLTAEALSPIPGGRAPVAAFLVMLLAVVALVLATACANLAGILLARAVARRHEIALRLAIGAGRARLVRQLLAETMMLFAIGGVAGLLFARAFTSATLAALPALPFPVDLSLALDARVIIFSAAVTLLAALLSGAAPALHASSGDVVSVLKDDAQPSSRAWLRHAFLVAQVAFSILLVVAAGLFMRALQAAGATDPGFDPRGVELASIDLSHAGYTDATGPRFSSALLDRVRLLPDVQAATMALVLPGGFETQRRAVTVPGLPPPSGQAFFSVDWNAVAPGYFATLRIPLVGGRDFTAADRDGAQPIAIVGEGTARQFWPGEIAVGKYLIQPTLESRGAVVSTRALLVVGVARDVTINSLVDGPSRSLVYVPLLQQYAPAITIAARTKSGARIANQIRALVASMNPNLPIVSARTLEDSAALGLVPQRVAVSVSSSLGLVAMLLAAIGLYGVAAYAVAQRTREIGIRLALGAEGGDVVRMVLRQGLSLAVAGTLIGLLLAAAASRALAAFLVGVVPLDPIVFSGATALFLTVALTACYIPARRATKVDPLVALRCE
jgi:predicted permease